MKAIAVALLLLAAVATQPAPTPRLAAFRILRPLTLAEASGDDEPDACAVLDADVFAHADPSLSDLRLFSAGPGESQELPYALTLSRTASTTDPAPIENVHTRSMDRVSLDLAMPARPYSSLDLDLRAQNFIASARVLGLQRIGDLRPTYLGTFSLFDLSARGLGEDLSLPLPESTFPLLHLDLSFIAASGSRQPKLTRGLVVSAQVPPTREAQTLYTPIAQLTSFTQRGDQLVASATLPAHVPLERVTFALEPNNAANFSRAVTVTARSFSTRTGQTVAPEVVTGQIARVHMQVGGQAIHESRMSVPFALGANAQAPAEVEIAIDNAGKVPLQLASVTLEMRQRKICFAVPAAGQTVTLAYAGEPSGTISSDFARTFDPTQPVRAAELGPEQRNLAFRPTVLRTPPWRTPLFLCFALLAAISLAGTFGLHFKLRAGR